MHEAGGLGSCPAWATVQALICLHATQSPPFAAPLLHTYVIDMNHPQLAALNSLSVCMKTLCNFLPRLFALGMLLVPLAPTYAAGINDTGNSTCYTISHTGVACNAAVSGDDGVNPRQDGRYGRSAAQAASQPLSKVGAGDIGFDFTKIANDGSVLLASATLGTAATQWACTRDNVTGLIWEIKTASGLRGTYNKFTWYSTNVATNGGVTGAIAPQGTLNTCSASGSAPFTQCNTESYVNAVNATNLCGNNDWRLPTRSELSSFFAYNYAQPAFDGTYFPNYVTNPD